MSIKESNKLKQVFAEKINGLIWRIQIQEETGSLAIESRNIDTKKVLFSVFNYKTGKIFFKEKAFAEPMNANLAYLSDDTLLLKLNEHVGSPENSGLISIELKSAKILWEKYNVAIQQAADYGIQIFDIKISPRRYYWINHLNASILPEPSQISLNSNSIIFPEINNEYSFPNFIEHGSIEGGVAELNIDGFQIICFHEKIEGNLQQKLLIYQNNKILHEDILINNIQKLQPESFFIIEKQLFYIRNKDEIVSYFV
jgi:hypothetical protein